MVIKLPPPASERSRSTLTVPAAQRVTQALRGGLVVRCWSTKAGRCRAAAIGKGRGVIGKAKRALRPRRSARVRMRTTRKGRAFPRRAVKRRRGAIVKVRADFGRGRVVTKHVRLRR